MYADVNGDGKIEQSQDFIKIGRGYTPEMNFSLNRRWHGKTSILQPSGRV